MDITEAARVMGSKGGKKNSDAQNRSRARNGKLGGRPRKNPYKYGLDKPERSAIIESES